MDLVLPLEKDMLRSFVRVALRRVGELVRDQKVNSVLSVAVQPCFAHQHRSYLSLLHIGV